jgi:Kef-type K+ transport system membrane component KefB
MFPVSQDVESLLLFIVLAVVPRALQRFRLPAPLTSFGLGMAGASLIPGFSFDGTLALLATLGISSLFLFAGLEIEFSDFKYGGWALITHLIVRLLAIAGITQLVMSYLVLPWQVGILMALAVLTPSAGFILDTLPTLDLNEDERYWIRMKAVTGELLALLMLFGVLQSESLERLAWSSSALVGMIVALPLIIIVLGRTVLPYAQGSEFSLLVIVGLVSALLTYRLGVYYLVGAFLAGLVAKLLKTKIPRLASRENLHAIQMFASFFAPFYFFHNGMTVPAGAFTREALMLGALLTLVALPARIVLVWSQRRFIKGESALASLRVAAALSPTLIFTLVLAAILRERFEMPDSVYGALLIYAGMSTLLPSFVMAKPIDFDVAPSPSGAVGSPSNGTITGERKI